MGKMISLIAGLAGAAALNILHESVKNKNTTLRIDLLGEQAVQKTVRYFGGNITDSGQLYATTLAGDLVSNAIYFSAIPSGKNAHLWLKAVSMGLLAGIGAIALPEPMGLNAKPVAKNNKVKAMTVGYYLFGAMVTALVAKALKRK